MRGPDMLITPLIVKFLNKDKLNLPDNSDKSLRPIKNIPNAPSQFLNSLVGFADAKGSFSITFDNNGTL